MLDFTNSAELAGRADLKRRGDVEQLLWAANNALFDLCEALSAGGKHKLSPQDLTTLIEQAQRAEWLATKGR